MDRKYSIGWLIVFIVAMAASLGIGAASISWTQLTDHDVMILLISRVPRLISLLLTGAGMAIAGLIMQQLSQNKFASPSTSGTLESASLGLLVAMIAWPDASLTVKVGIAFCFALTGSLLFMGLLERMVYKDALFIPLVGIIFGRVIAALTTFLAYRYDLLQSLNSWLYGDFSAIIKGRYELLYITVPVALVAYAYAHRFTIVGFGNSFALGLGVSYQQVRLIGLGLVALLVSSEVLTVGEIAFIGLIVPNIVSLYCGDHVRRILPYTAFGGSLFLLVADCIGRLVVYPYELTVSLVVGVVGSGLFLWLLWRRRTV